MTYDKPSSYADLPKDIVATGHFNESDTYVISRPNGMNDSLIAYTVDGEGYIRTPHSNEQCKAGDIMILKQGTPHEYGTDLFAH